jgi:hypothetical protein
MPFVNLLGYESKIERTQNVYTGIVYVIIAYKISTFPEQLLEISLFIT